MVERRDNTLSEHKFFVREKTISKFAFETFKKLLDIYKTEQCMEGNTKRKFVGYMGIALPELKSHNLIACFDKEKDAKQLSSSNKLRFFTEKLKIALPGFHYFSNEWAGPGKKRALSYNNLKAYVEKVSEGAMTIANDNDEFLLMQSPYAQIITENDLFNDKSYEGFKSYNKQRGENIIYYGAPGTGKSYRASERKNIIRTVFHSETSFFDFIGAYKPYVHEGTITYEFVPGPFMKALVMAYKNPQIHVNLIIEEINRANAGAVFGEIFQLLDRDITGRSEYFISVEQPIYDYLNKEINLIYNRLAIPSNLSIIATMNSADQGVFPLDSAFRRRWRFIYCPIDFTLLPEEYEELSVYYNNTEMSWEEFALGVNKRLGDIKINEDKHIGPFFLKPQEIEDIRTFAEKLLMYLWDDVVRHNRELLFMPKYGSLNSIIKDFLAGEEIFSFKLQNEQSS